MPGDHYYDRDSQRHLGPASETAEGLRRARDAAEEAAARLRELQASTGANDPHTPKALDLLATVLAEIDAALASLASR